MSGHRLLSSLSKVHAEGEREEGTRVGHLALPGLASCWVNRRKHCIYNEPSCLKCREENSNKLSSWSKNTLTVISTTKTIECFSGWRPRVGTIRRVPWKLPWEPRGFCLSPGIETWKFKGPFIFLLHLCSLSFHSDGLFILLSAIDLFCIKLRELVFVFAFLRAAGETASGFCTKSLWGVPQPVQLPLQVTENRSRIPESKKWRFIRHLIQLLIGLHLVSELVFSRKPTPVCCPESWVKAQTACFA